MQCAPSDIVSLPSLLQKKEQLIKELEEVNKEQAQTILDLQCQNTVLKAQITKLEARLGLHSGNSSFPPSRDLSPPPPKPVSLRKKSGKKAGGQKNVEE